MSRLWIRRQRTQRDGEIIVTHNGHDLTPVRVLDGPPCSPTGPYRDGIEERPAPDLRGEQTAKLLEFVQRHASLTAREIAPSLPLWSDRTAASDRKLRFGK